MLLGRAAERARIDRLLTEARSGTGGVLVIRGEPGIGKSSLLADAAAHAEGMTVLTARGLESEVELPFAGLLALLRPILPVLDRTPVPQAAALRSALGLGPSGAEDRVLVAAATLSALVAQAEDQPVL